MSPEEKKLRDQADMVEISYFFFEEKLSEALEIMEAMDEFETPEDFHNQEIEIEQEIKYLLMRSNFEKKEMDKLEVKIKRYIDESEG